MKYAVYSLVIVLLLSFTGSALAEAKRPVAALKEVVGVAKIHRADTKQNTSANVGTILYNGDRLNTGDRAAVALLFIDGSMLKIKENSEVTINAERKKDNQLDTKVDMPLGEVWAKVTRRDSKFDIETPSSVASVKGTEFSVSVDEEGISNLFVFEGIVEFQNELGKVQVKRNQKSTITPNQAPEEPKKMTKKDRQQTQETGPTWNLDIKKPTDPKAPNQAFEIQVRALNPETSKQDMKCAELVVVNSPSGGGQFSLDGNSWSNELEGILAGGNLTLMAKSRVNKDLEIAASGQGCRPARTTVEIQQTRQQKKQEGDKAKSIAAKAGMGGELEGLEYSGGEVKDGSGSIDDILGKIESGELIITGKEIIEGANGEKKVILKVKPASGGKSGQ